MPMSLKKAVEIALRDGLPIPEEYVKFVKNQDREARGVVQVWRCYSSECYKEYESPVPLKSVGCGCGHQCRKIWPKESN